MKRFPDTVTQMESLEVLMCGQNIISDVPQSIGELKSIKRASFASNNLVNLNKFAEFDIPYSYQISFDLNYLDLTDETNMDILEGLPQRRRACRKRRSFRRRRVKSDTESLVVQCGFDMAELERIGENAAPYRLMLFRREKRWC